MKIEPSDKALIDTTTAPAPPRSIFTASGVKDLEVLHRRGKTRGRLGVKIILPGLDEERRANFERRVERSLAACGCNEGAVALLLYLIVIPTLIFTGRLAPSWPLGWIAVGAGLLAALVAGKFFGLGIARFTLYQTLNEIKRAFQQHAKGA
jgi:hypothetical protein